MAQLKDTNIDGDLNVSGTIAGGGIINHYSSLEEIGLTYACSIIDIINAIEPMSKVSFWLNNNTNIRTEVLNVFGITDKWGIFSVERNGDSLWTLKFKLYNEPITYVMRYTTTNDLGYSKVGSSDYLKKQYFNWKGVWVGVIEYPDFFFVYFRGTLTSVIEKGKYYTITSDVTSNVNSASPILFTYGNVGECIIDSSGISLNLINQGLNNGTWICGQAFVYKMPA